MRGSEFVRALPVTPGASREGAILDAVTAGQARLVWTTIEARHLGHIATIRVSEDALAIGDADDWVRVTVNHTTAQQIADHFNALLPTTRISDLIFGHAAVRLTPCLQHADADMALTSRMLQHHEAVELKRAGRPGLVSTVGKDWVVTNRLVGRPDRSANYGWHDSAAPNGLVWQPLGLAHDRWHVDYSQVVRLVDRNIEVDGVARDLVDVLRDPELAPLVSSEGPISLWRLEAVPLTGSGGTIPVSPPPPAGPRTLRRGMQGPDVAKWQEIVGVPPDGIFGAATEDATKAWQASRLLTSDGIVGPATRAAATRIPEEPPEASGGTIRDFPFVQARNYRKVGGRAVGLVVIHTMEADEKPNTAEAVANWFASAGAPMASAHYCIDVDSIVQCVEEEDVAYHAPGANETGIGLEHAGYAKQSPEDWADAYSEAMLRRSAELTADICDRHQIPVVFVDADGLRAGTRGITTHAEVSKAFRRSTHTDPGPSFPMAHYLSLVTASR